VASGEQKPARSGEWRVASGEPKPVGAQSRPKHYKDLLVWQKGMALAWLVYKLTKRFPDGEKYGLTSQLRRAAVSVPSNIAEGQARQSTKEFLQLLSHAQGSLAEVETQLLLGIELGFVQHLEVDPALSETDELQKMLVALKRKLSSYAPRATPHSPLAQRSY
jgi:four helix bundle protein